MIFLQAAGACLIIGFTVIAMKTEEERQILAAAGFTAQAIAFGLSILSMFDIIEVTSFDDSDWPSTTTYTNSEIGVDNKKAYTIATGILDYSSQIAKFIWCTNLMPDNEVMNRKTIRRLRIRPEISMMELFKWKIFRFFNKISST